MRGVGHFRSFFAAALVSAGAVVIPLSSASAQCAPDPAASGQTVTCAGNDPDGFAAGGGVNNLTVNIQPGATVSENGTSAINVNDSSIVTNGGTLTGGVGITGIFGGQTNTITNAATGDVTVGNNGTGVFVSGGSAVTNFGAITSGDGGGLSGGIVAINDGNTIVNAAGATITGGASTAGIFTQGNAVAITNGGAITGGDSSIGVFAQGSNSILTSTGTISGGAGSSAGFVVAGDANTISNGGTITLGNTGIGIFLQGDSNTITNSGTITVGDGGTGIDATTFGGGSINRITNTGTINVGAGGTGILVSGDGTVFNSGTINAGTGLFAIDFCLCSPASTLTLAPTSVINGLVRGTNTTFQLGGTGTGTFNLNLIGTGQQYEGFTAFNKVDASSWILTGTGNQDWTVLGGSLTVNGTVNGAVAVNSGALAVNGTVTGAVTVNAGTTLSGTGTVGNTTINGGTLAPGNSIGTLTVQGNLVLSSAATYFVELDPSNADRTLVSGTASLAGTVQAVFASGAYVQRNYTILTANGGLNSSSFGALNVTSLPAGFNAALTYNTNNVFITLTAVLGTDPTPTPTPTPGPTSIPFVPLNQNQRNVATTLNNFFNNGGLLPARFVEVFALTGTSLRNALTHLSGEIATQGPQAAFSSVDYFLNLMLDPFVTSRGGDVASSGGPGANQYAGEESEADAYAGKRKQRSAREQEAYAAMARKAVPRINPYDPRWSMWGAAYGGELKADGNALAGSRDTSTRAYGFAVGADYRFSPDTLAGFAMSGGGTNFSLAQAGGSGRSDVFQAGAFVRHNIGQGYLKGAVAYGWHDVHTERTVGVAGIDRLDGRYNANSFGARGEGGYRFVTPWMGVGMTPYAAAQAITYFMPGYSERVEAGLNTFALNYASRDVTTSRSEFGLRADKSFALESALVTLRARAAWAHYFDDNRSLTASFQALPGTSFVVTGAAQARDAALVSASAEARWMNGFSLAGVFEGEFSGQTRGYAGKGILRYAW